MRSADSGDHKQTHVIIDEIHRYPTSMTILNTIRESPKFRLSYFFSAHQPHDFGRMLGTLKSSGVSYMLFNTSVDNLRIFQEEIRPFTIQECLETKPFHAKCIVNYGNEYVTFDAGISKPIDMERKNDKIDRSYILEKCMKEYGSNQG